MPAYTVRVELHGAQRGDYDRLHVEMRKQGFATTITGDNGITYRLPPAEYIIEGPVSDADVLARAKAAAAKINPAYAVFVTQAQSWTWHGLARVEHRRAG